MFASESVNTPVSFIVMFKRSVAEGEDGIKVEELVKVPVTTNLPAS